MLGEMRSCCDAMVAGRLPGRVTTAHRRCCQHSTQNMYVGRTTLEHRTSAPVQLDYHRSKYLGKPAKKKVLKLGHCPKVSLALPSPSY